MGLLFQCFYRSSRCSVLPLPSCRQITAPGKTLLNILLQILSGVSFADQSCAITSQNTRFRCSFRIQNRLARFRCPHGGLYHFTAISIFSIIFSILSHPGQFFPVRKASHFRGSTNVFRPGIRSFSSVPRSRDASSRSCDHEKCCRNLFLLQKIE